MVNEELTSEKISKQDKLKKLFLSGTISGSEFLEAVFRLDQGGDHTQEAESNIVLLKDEKVKELLVHKGLSRDYYNLLSLSYFHQGQKTLQKAYFKKALDTAIQNAHFADYLWWIYYIKGTLAFFEKDIRSLEKAIKHTGGKNKEILNCLLEALRDGKDPAEYIFICSNCGNE